MIRVNVAKAGALLASLGNSLGDEPPSKGAKGLLRAGARTPDGVCGDVTYLKQSEAGPRTLFPK